MSHLPGLVIRKAGPEDLPEIARLMRQWSNTAWNFMVQHTPGEDLQFIRRCFDAGPIWTAFEEDRVLGFCAVRRGWIDLFHVGPELHGRGIGRALLKRALTGRRRVKLWTFQRNIRTRRFYALQGFHELRLTDGGENEEGEPDVLLEWRG